MFDSFLDVANALLSIFREAWGALVVAIISFVLLALLIQLMRSAGSSWTSSGVSSIACSSGRRGA
jgi:hypothetical protein